MCLKLRNTMENKGDLGKTLRWELDGISNRDQTKSFLQLFESSIPVYQPFTKELYLTYRFDFAEEEGEWVTINPDYRPEERLYDIQPQVVEDLGMFIFPGDVIGKEGIYMKYRNWKKTKYAKSIEQPLKQAIEELKIRFLEEKGRPFLPIFPNQTINEYEKGMPHLKIAVYNSEIDSKHSPFEKKQVADMIYRRLNRIRF